MIVENFLDFFLFFGISIGLFITIALLISRKKNDNASIVLSVILVLATLMLLGRLFFLRFFENVLLFRIGTIVDGTVFIFGPLVLLYLRIILFRKKSDKQTNIIYFLPFFCYAIFSLYTYTYDSEEYYKKVISGYFNKHYFFIEILGIFTNLFFVIKSYFVLKNYKDVIHKNISFNQNTIQFSTYFLLVYSACILFWIIGFINLYFLRNYSVWFNYDTVWIAIPILIYIVGFYLLTQPEIFRLYTNNESKDDKPAKNRISESQIKELEVKLHQLMEVDKIYHKNDLSLTDLAKTLEISNNDLSWLINTNFHTNFYEYVNKFRVDEFIKRIKNGDSKKHTISAISLDVGFNSKSTFYKAFKLITKTTPSKYIKENSII